MVQFSSQGLAVPHPTSLTLGHLPPGGRYCGFAANTSINCNLTIPFPQKMPSGEPEGIGVCMGNQITSEGLSNL